MATIAPPPKPINPALLDSEQYIDKQIGRTRRALKLLDLASGLITLAIGLLAFVLVAAVIDQWVVPGGLSEGGRTALFGLLLAGVAWHAWRRFVPLLRPINPVYAAATIEQGAPSLKNSLLNLLLFRSHRQQMSARVYNAIQQQAAQRLSTAPLETAVDRSNLLRLGYALLLAVAVCALYAVLSPKNLALSAGRVLAPWSELSAPTRVQIIDVRPGEISVARGERIAISAEVDGLKEDEPVRIRYSTADEQLVDESIVMERPSPEARRFEAMLPRAGHRGSVTGVEQDLSYWIEAGDARSREFKVTVFTRPTIIVQKVRYEYPAYTGFPSKDVGNTGDVRGLEGTWVTISALANQPIKNAYVDFNADGTSDMRMAVDGTQATARFQLALRDDRRTPQFGSYWLKFTSADGRSNSEPPKYAIEVTPDYGPEVRIIAPEEPERTARVDEIVPIEVEGRDPDFALKRVWLVGKVGDREIEMGELLSARHEGRFGGIKPFTPGDAELKPGDVLEYWAKALDNRTPESNIGFSEHRKLIIAGPAEQPPQNQRQRQKNQQQQPGDQQQQGEGEPGEGGHGEQGPQQPGGEAGGEQGESQQGAGGGQQAGEGNEEGQGENQSGGGAGDTSKESQGAEGEQPSGQGGAAGNQEGQDSDSNPSPTANGAEQPTADDQQPGAGGAPQGGRQDQADQSKGQPQEGQQPGGEGKAQPEKVSAEGDDDATAFERMAEHLDGQQDESQGGGQPQEGGAQQQGERAPMDQQGDDQQKGGQAAGGEQEAGDQKPGENASRTEAAEGQDASQNPDAQPQAQREGADPAGGQQGASPQQGAANQQQTRPDKSTGPAGQTNNESQQKPPAEGAQPQGAAENAGDAEQQTAPAGENPNPRQGGDVPREGQKGDGNPQQQESQQPSPDSTMNRNNGDAGSGGSTGEEQGSPANEQVSHKQAREKSDDDNGKRTDDQEPPMASPDKRESDSRGGQGGEQSGGGQEGGGQQADAAGKGDAGQHEAADEGGGRADEQGQGETGTEAGRDQLAEGETGESSGDQPGAGGKQGPPKSAPQAGGKEPGEPQASPADASQQGKQQPVPGQPGDQQAQGGPPPADASGQQPGEQPADGQPPSGKPPGEGNEPNQQPGGEQPGGQGSASATSQGGSHGSANPPASNTDSAQEVADKANLEFARQQTDLVLERLDEQLAKKEVDQELLESLGWNEDDLRRFVDRWKNLKTRASGDGEEAETAGQELDAALRSLGLRPNRTMRFRAEAKADELRVNDAYRTRTPAEYADRVREYSREVAAGDND